MNSLVLIAHLLNPNLSPGETRNLLIEKVSNMNLENTSVRICIELECDDYASLGTLDAGKVRTISGKGGEVPFETIRKPLEIHGLSIDVEYNFKDENGKLIRKRVKNLK